MYLPGTIATPSLDRRQYEVGLLLNHVGPVGFDRFERLVRHRNHHAARARARDEGDRLHDAEVSVVVVVRVAVRVLRRAAGRFRASAQIVVCIIPHWPDGIASPCDIPCVPILGDRRKRFEEEWGHDLGSNSTARDAMPRDDVCCLERGRSLYVDGPTRFSKIEIEMISLGSGLGMLGGAGGNIGVSSGPDGTLLVDDQFAPLKKKIQVSASALFSSPIRFLLNTHSRADHMVGNENLGKAGVLIMAHEHVRARLTSDPFIATRNPTLPAAAKKPGPSHPPCTDQPGAWPAFAARGP